jgi:hypothetical protein
MRGSFGFVARGNKHTPARRGDGSVSHPRTPANRETGKTARILLDFDSHPCNALRL